jgi:hypothetical protein
MAAPFDWDRGGDVGVEIGDGDTKVVDGLVDEGMDVVEATNRSGL